MIPVSPLVSHLGVLTGDAVKVAVYLSTVERDDEGWIRADGAWLREHAKKIGMGDRLLRNCLHELANEGLLVRDGRWNFNEYDYPMSDPCRSLARSEVAASISGTSAAVVPNEPPPWTTEKVETRSGSTRRATRSRKVPATSTALPGFLRPEPVEASAHKIVISEFNAMFAECNGGARPLWRGKEGAIVKRLLKTHDADEIIRRARIMFYEKRRFPAPPYDIGTLSAHFDKFAASAKAGGIAGLDKSKTGAAYYGKVTDV